MFVCTRFVTALHGQHLYAPACSPLIARAHKVLNLLHAAAGAVPLHVELGSAARLNV
jgi:hypothetical protein